MEASIYVTAAMALALAFMVVKQYSSGASAKRRLPPSGPLAFPVIGHLYLMKYPLHQTLAKISARYGPILLLRFGSRVILHISSPDLAEECFTTNDVVFANRGEVLATKHFGYNNTNLGSADYGPHWRNLRRIAALEIFSASRINALSPLRAKELHSVLHKLYKEAPSTVDMKILFTELTMNTIMRMVSGKSYCGEGATAGAETGRQFMRCIRQMFDMSRINLEDVLPFLRIVSGLERRMKNVAEEMDSLFQDIVDERRRRMEVRHGSAGEELEELTTIVDVMLELQRRNPDYYTDSIIKGMIESIVLAGTETSATTMEWAMALMLNHPAVFHKAKNEIDIHVGRKRLAEEADLPNLRYLHCIIKEVLCLFPPGPFLVPHFSSEDCTVGGYDIPRGTILMVNIYAIQRDPKLWTDPTEFKPERFEDGKGVGYKSFPFGSGRRSCPGENLAMRTMPLALASMIQCFEWESIGEEMVDMAESDGLTMPKARPLLAKCRPHNTTKDILNKH